MNFLSLFSGIGGIDLGLERAGMRCVGQVEIDPYCRRVLAKHWPGVRQFADVREVVAWWRPERRVPESLHHRMRPFAGVDVIAGGFPCQDISNAGKRAGISGERSGLWHEFRRLVCTIRPRIVLVENVAALLVRGIDTVLGALDEGGYDAEWDCVPASAVGAPHIRNRVFIVAYPRAQARRWVGVGRWEQQPEGGAEAGPLADAIGQRRDEGRGERGHEEGARIGRDQSGAGGEVASADVPDTDGSGLWVPGRSQTVGATGEIREEIREQRVRPHPQSVRSTGELTDPASVGRRPGRQGRLDPSGEGQRECALSHAVFAGLEGHERGQLALARFRRSNADPAGSGWWSAEPDVGRVADGVPNRVDRLKGLGNAVVPQVAEWIGRRIMEAAGKAAV